MLDYLDGWLEGIQDWLDGVVRDNFVAGYANLCSSKAAKVGSLRVTR